MHNKSMTSMNTIVWWNYTELWKNKVFTVLQHMSKCLDCEDICSQLYVQMVRMCSQMMPLNNRLCSVVPQFPGVFSITDPLSPKPDPAVGGTTRRWSPWTGFLEPPSSSSLRVKVCHLEGVFCKMVIQNDFDSTCAGIMSDIRVKNICLLHIFNI